MGRLMAALWPALRNDPATAFQWMLAAFGLSFGIQALAIFLLAKGPLAHVAGPLALAAGNRNIAIFLVALPPDILTPLMIFIGCWQLPMYLTPMLLPQLYRWALAHD